MPAGAMEALNDVAARLDQAGRDPARITDAVLDVRPLMERAERTLRQYQTQKHDPARAADAAKFVTQLVKSHDHLAHAIVNLATAGHVAGAALEIDGSMFADADGALEAAHADLKLAAQLAKPVP